MHIPRTSPKQSKKQSKVVQSSPNQSKLILMKFLLNVNKISFFPFCKPHPARERSFPPSTKKINKILNQSKQSKFWSKHCWQTFPPCNPPRRFCGRNLPPFFQFGLEFGLIRPFWKPCLMRVPEHISEFGLIRTTLDYFGLLRTTLDYNCFLTFFNNCLLVCLFLIVEHRKQNVFKFIQFPFQNLEILR